MTHLQKTQSFTQTTIGSKNTFPTVQNPSEWCPSKRSKCFTKPRSLSPKIEQLHNYQESSCFYSDYPYINKVDMQSASQNNDQCLKSPRKRTRAAQRRFALSFPLMLDESMAAMLYNDYNLENDTFEQDKVECGKKKRRILDHDNMILSREDLSGVNAMFTLMTVHGPKITDTAP